MLNTSLHKRLNFYASLDSYLCFVIVQFYGHLWCLWLCNINICKNKLIELKS